MRKTRESVLGETGRANCYHVVSRVVDRRLVFGDEEKEFFRNLLVLLVCALALFPLNALLHASYVPAMAYVLGLGVSALASSAYVLYLGRNKTVADTDAPVLTLRNELPASLTLMGNALLQVLNRRGMLMLLGSLANASTAGVFSFAFKLSTLPDFVASSVKAPAAPMIAKLFGQRDLPALSALLQRSVRLIALFSVPASLVLLVFARPVMVSEYA